MKTPHSPSHESCRVLKGSIDDHGPTRPLSFRFVWVSRQDSPCCRKSPELCADTRGHIERDRPRPAQVAEVVLACLTKTSHESNGREYRNPTGRISQSNLGNYTPRHDDAPCECELGCLVHMEDRASLRILQVRAHGCRVLCRCESGRSHRVEVEQPKEKLRLDGGYDR